jgi:uncharacterized DUF497 family protein
MFSWEARKALKNYEKNGVPFEEASTVFRDPINGRADALVTYNVRDFALPGNRFRIPVVRPADLLKKVTR